MNRRRIFRGWVLWLLVFLLVLAIAPTLFGGTSDYKREDLNVLQSQIESGQVTKAKIFDTKQRIEVETRDGKKFASAYATDQALPLANSLKDHNVAYEVSVGGNGILLQLLINFLPILLVVGLLLF